MNILFLIFSFNTGGIERQLIEMANNMVSKGHSVSLCIINHNYETKLLTEFDDKVKIFKFDRPVGSNKKIAYMFRLSDIVKKNKVDVIHCQEPTGVVFSVLSKLRNPHIRIVETIHDIGEADDYSHVELSIADMFCKQYIAISQSVKKELLQRGIAENKISVIYNAVNIEKFRMCDREPQQLSSSNDYKIMLGNVARFYPEKKGQDVLVRAIEILKIKYPNICCLFAGGIYRGQDENWIKLKKYVMDHDLNDNVRFMGNVDDVPNFLSQIDIFVLPSYHEGFGISLIEAMAMGIPCVASNIDGPKEILGDDSLGRLFEAGNAEDLADKLQYVIEHYEQYDRKTISKYVSDNFSIDAMVDEHLKLY